MLSQARLQSHAVEIAEKATAAILLEPTKAAVSSRIGGDPDLPAKAEWATFRATKKALCERYTASSVDGILDDAKSVDMPFAFMAQIDLEEVGDHDAANLLPDDGLLSFFFRPDLMFEEKVGNSKSDWRYSLPCAVLYSPKGTKRTLTKSPEAVVDWRTEPVNVAFDHAWLVPEIGRLPNDLGRASVAYIEWRQAELELPQDQMVCFPTGTHDGDVPPKGGRVLLSTRLRDPMYDGSFSWAYFCIDDASLAAHDFSKAFVRISTE